VLYILNTVLFDLFCIFKENNALFDAASEKVPSFFDKTIFQKEFLSKKQL